MKVKLEKDYRKNYTVDDYYRAKKVIAYEKETMKTQQKVGLNTQSMKR